MVEIGDNVRVKTTGRSAQIVAELGNGLYRVEYLPEPVDDPIDRDSADVLSDDAGGVYLARDLEPMS